jgi:excisionase family DNA binding protein
MKGALDPISISVAHAAELLGIGTTKVYEDFHAGRLPGAYRSGRRILVHLETLRTETAKLAHPGDAS